MAANLRYLELCVVPNTYEELTVEQARAFGRCLVQYKELRVSSEHMKSALALISAAPVVECVELTWPGTLHDIHHLQGVKFDALLTEIDSEIDSTSSNHIGSHSMHTLRLKRVMVTTTLLNAIVRLLGDRRDALRALAFSEGNCWPRAIKWQELRTLKRLRRIEFHTYLTAPWHIHINALAGGELPGVEVDLYEKHLS